jgi:hypothetical protein
MDLRCLHCPWQRQHQPVIWQRRPLKSLKVNKLEYFTGQSKPFFIMLFQEADIEQGSRSIAKTDVDKKGQLSNSSVFLSNLSYDANETDIENILKNVNIFR